MNCQTPNFCSEVKEKFLNYSMKKLENKLVTNEQLLNATCSQQRNDSSVVRNSCNVILKQWPCQKGFRICDILNQP